jgi:hypothetical protein
MASLLDVASGAVGGFEKATTGGDTSSYRKVRYNKPTTSADIPESYGGTGKETGDTYKHGGKVRRTGKARVHKGERVLTRKQARKYDRKRGRK